MRIRGLILCLLGTSLTLPGCAEPPLVSVAGTVTVRDEPLEGARVLFVPQSGTPGKGGAGLTNDKGYYQIIPLGNPKGKGLPAGTYKVVLNKKMSADGKQLSPDATKLEAGAEEHVPEPFCDLQKTPLLITVDAEGKSYDLPLLSGKK